MQYGIEKKEIEKTIDQKKKQLNKKKEQLKIELIEMNSSLYKGRKSGNVFDYNLIFLVVKFIL